MSRFVIALTGASGMPYARRTLNLLLADGHTLFVVVSASGNRVLEAEEGLRLEFKTRKQQLLEWAGVSDDAQLEVLSNSDIGATIASGSSPVNGMVVVPCSSATLGRIANGTGEGLIERAADVCLKERRRLILVLRETPLSLIHIKNMYKATEAGAVVMPAAPGFYHRPQSLGDLIDMLAGRILAGLGVSNEVHKPWLGMSGE